MDTISYADENPIKRIAQVKYYKNLYGEQCVKSIRFSCAYLFRIKVDEEYLLIKDEQRRNKFQPIGGVYKYTDKSIIHKFKASQSTNLGYKTDFNDDLRIMVPRNKANSFYRWFQKQIGRETIENLYREFKEEIIDKLILSSEHISAFEEINYSYCGESIAANTYKDERTKEKRLQLRITDIVELNLTENQLNALRELKSHSSPLYCFATEEEINDARLNKKSLGGSETIISSHSYKILPSEERNLKVSKKKSKTYTAKFNGKITSLAERIKKIESNLKVCDENSPYFFISYNSVDKLTVYNICTAEPFKNCNLWIDRTEVGAAWNEDVGKALSNDNCKLSIVFINEYYLFKSDACLQEARIIVENNIDHIIYLIGLDREYIKNLFLRWSDNDDENKERLKVLKKLFKFDNDTNHIENTVIEIKDNLQADHTHFINFINKNLSKV